MNAEQIIARAVWEIFAEHQLVWKSKSCSCGQWKLGPKERAYGTMEFQHKRHISQEVAKRLTERSIWKQAA